MHMARSWQKRGLFTARTVLVVLRGLIIVTWSRWRRGPQLPEWTWLFEWTTFALREQQAHTSALPGMGEQRAYFDSIVIAPPWLKKVSRVPIKHETVRGHWFTPRSGVQDRTLLYLHGGGYAFYTKHYESFLTLVALAAQAKTFVLDYRLVPENPFPAQLEDALAAYRWLLAQGQDPRRLIVIGDSAGGNLTLALLLALREAQEPLPLQAICLSPWTDMNSEYKSMSSNESSDWINKQEANQWADWFLNGHDAKDPLVSPLYADLKGLPPIYIQAGDAEILIDMINLFVEKAQGQGAAVTLETWKAMNHVFQAYGPLIPQATEALKRLGEFIAALPYPQSESRTL
jgi:epsilon-lactone hydrolase